METLFDTQAIEEAIIGELWADERDIYTQSLTESLFMTANAKLAFGVLKKYTIRNDYFGLKKRLEMDGYTDVDDVLSVLVSCSAKAVHTMRLPGHIQTLREVRIRKRLFDFAAAGTITTADMAEIHKLTSPGNLKTYVPKTLKELSLSFPSDYEKRVQAYKDGVPYPTGYHCIDNVTGGIIMGNITLIGGRTSFGKSTLMTNIAVNLAKKDVPVLYLSCEMEAVELFDRIIASQSSVESCRIKFGKLNNTESTKICEMLGAGDFYLKPLTICYTPGLTVPAVQMLVEDLRPQVVFVDHVQTMRFPQGQGSRAQAIEDAAYQMKDIAGELGIGVVIGSQVSRDAVKGGQNTKMQPAYYKGSGGLEDAAAVAMEIKLAEGADKEAPEWPMDLEIQKARFGRVGIQRMVFERQYTRFREVYE